MKKSTTVCSLLLVSALHATAADAVLRGIVDLPSMKVALIEMPQNFTGRELMLAEGQLEGSCELVQIDMKQRKVHAVIDQKDCWLSLDSSDTNTAGRGMIFKQAGFRSILALYAEFTGRSLLQHPRLDQQTKF